MLVTIASKTALRFSSASHRLKSVLMDLKVELYVSRGPKESKSKLNSMIQECLHRS